MESSTSEIVTSIATTMTTTQPVIPIFTCDFSITLCFQDSELIITNGSEFASDDITEPPRAPFSDVSSIRKCSSLFHSKLIDI
jgi:hypothetical protein